MNLNPLTSAARPCGYNAKSGDIETDVAFTRQYMLMVYRKKGVLSPTFNKLRYHLASTKNFSAAQLPPIEDAFRQHVYMRARYRTAVWVNSHIVIPIM